jgi:hypothetical protein
MKKSPPDCLDVHHDDAMEDGITFVIETAFSVSRLIRTSCQTAFIATNGGVIHDRSINAK